MTEAEWLAAAEPGPMLEFLGGRASDRKLRLFNCACVRRVWQLLPEGALRRGVDVAERYVDGRCDDAEHAQAAREAADAYAVLGGAGDAALERYVVRGSMDWEAARALNDETLDDAEFDRYWEAIRTAYRQVRLSREDVPLVVARYEAAMAAYMGSFREVRLTGWAEYMYVHGSAAVAVSDAALQADPPAEGEEDRFLQPNRRELAAQCGLLRDIFGSTSCPPRPIPHAVLLWNGSTVSQLALAAYDYRRLPEGTLDPARLAVLADALEEAGCPDADLLGHLRGPGPHVRGCWPVDLLLGKS
jgi:hypothetical protein